MENRVRLVKPSIPCEAGASAGQSKPGPGPSPAPSDPPGERALRAS
jgi:hypothetical protein